MFLSGASEQSSDQDRIKPHLRAVSAIVSAGASSVSVREKSIASVSRLTCPFKFHAPFPCDDRRSKLSISIWAAMRRRYRSAACGKPAPGASSIDKKSHLGERKHVRIVTP